MKLFLRPAGALVLLAGLTACDIPTGLPRWETTWITPGQEIRVSVAELLPAGLAVNGDTSAILIQIDTVTGGFQLSDFCPACPPAVVAVPKPAFTGTETVDVPLPGPVGTATTSGGIVIVELENGFDFDPIRPSASARGSITLELRSGATLIGSLVIDGTQRALPPGATLRDTLNIVDGTIGDLLTMEVEIVSPAGDNTTMSPNDAFTVDVWSPGIEVSEATITLTAQSIEGVEAELDLTDVDLGDRLKEGAVILEITNPFGVAGTLTLTVDPADGAPIVKPVPLSAAATSQVVVSFTEAEMETLVGQSSEMTITGAVNGGNVTVRPDMEMALDARLRVTVEVGGELDEEGGDND